MDLSEVDFSLLDELPAGVLTNALRRVLRENSSGTDHFASFQNRI
ncbi:FxSxx-COOH cyclophane-containing RiPP peptide [Lentzea sp. NPDC004789]